MEEKNDDKSKQSKLEQFEQADEDAQSETNSKDSAMELDFSKKKKKNGPRQENYKFLKTPAIKTDGWPNDLEELRSHYGSVLAKYERFFKIKTYSGYIQLLHLWWPFFIEKWLSWHVL